MQQHTTWYAISVHHTDFEGIGEEYSSLRWATQPTTFEAASLEKLKQTNKK
jgi:hypothetical protein